MYSQEILELISSLEQKECDDCGKKEVEWASVRKGTVVCSECFSYHSYLGPSVSYLRHLRKSAWDEEHIRLVHALNSSNTNMIWEGTLHEGTAKFKKPEPLDPSHLKEQFVREKYEKMTFQPKKGKEEDAENSLNKQLIACARSDFAHVTLRLIAMGADVNYVDADTGDTALHVAAREGNCNQVELLFLYGADVNTQNRDGQLPYLAAKEAGHIVLSQRIYEFFWYIFDRFTFYLCNRKPDHRNNQDFFIPEVTEKNYLSKTVDSRSAIGNLPRAQFFDLCEDAFDEVTRRENAVNWSTTKWAKLTKGASPLFLPNSPQMTAARNQRRQKLAKFSPTQFTILLIDLLKDQKRRVSGDPNVSLTETPRLTQKPDDAKPLRLLKKSDIFPDYDEVAAVVPSSSSLNALRSSQNLLPEELSNRLWDEILEHKERIGTSEHIINTLTRQNEELTKLVHSLQAQLINTNSELISVREEVGRLNRINLTRRMPSPLAILETPERNMPLSGISQSFSRRESEDRIESGARWRSNSSDRRNSNDQSKGKKVERRAETHTESSSTFSHPSYDHPFEREERERGLTHVLKQGELVTKAIRQLLKRGEEGLLEENASRCAHEISLSISTLITMLPPTVDRKKINILVDAVVKLNAKCNSLALVPIEIKDSTQTVAETLRYVLLDV